MRNRHKLPILALVLLAGIGFFLLGKLHVVFYFGSLVCGIILAAGSFALWENYRDRHVPHTRDFHFEENR
ncbi:MAG TPA: hypothetical protein VJJ20_01705 [Candidatus Paceibacterota bacterium]